MRAIFPITTRSVTNGQVITIDGLIEQKEEGLAATQQIGNLLVRKVAEQAPRVAMLFMIVAHINGGLFWGLRFITLALVCAVNTITFIPMEQEKIMRFAP